MKLLNSIGLLLVIFSLPISYFIYPKLFFKKLPPPFSALPQSKSPSPSQAFISPLSIEQIFEKGNQWTATLSAQRVRSLIATGDVIPARSVNFKTLQANNFAWAFEKTAQTLSSADITFINLETPLIDNCPATNEGMVFCGDLRHIEGLKFAGVDVVSLANNHAGNYGSKGIASTQKLMAENNILISGLQNPAYLNVRGLKFVFLSYNDIPAFVPGISQAQEAVIVSQIIQVRQNADIVIAAFHWGIEYTNQPSQRQKDLAHLAIDSGADLVIGNHPHWIQPIEIYKNRLIVYAHGNFIFDQMWSIKTREGIVGRYTFYDKSLIAVEFLPVQIDDFGQPHFVQQEQKQAILEEIKNNSLNLAASF